MGDSITTLSHEKFAQYLLFWGSRHSRSTFFLLILSRLTTFCAGGVYGISSFRGAGDFGTAGVGDTSISSGGDIGTAISNASYITSSENSFQYCNVISLIYLGLN